MFAFAKIYKKGAIRNPGPSPQLECRLLRPGIPRKILLDLVHIGIPRKILLDLVHIGPFWFMSSARFLCDAPLTPWS